jgi:hypothetical protein
VPGRHELDDTQELNYRFGAQTIVDAGYTGYIAHEYRPTPGKDPLEISPTRDRLYRCMNESEGVRSRRALRDPEMRDPKYPGTFWKGWGATLVAKRPEISLQTTDEFVTRMFETDPDFVFTVTRDFVRSCRNPVLILPDEVPAHPYAVAMECAMLAPNAEVSMFPWKEPKERISISSRGTAAEESRSSRANTRIRPRFLVSLP